MASEDAFELPWLKRLLIFGRRPPALSRRQWTIIFLLSSCGLFSSYDGQIFTLALPQIQKDLDVSDREAAFLGSFIAAGPFLGLPLLLGADRYGRKAVLMWTVIPFSMLTGLTAVCSSAFSFALCQISARVFISAEHIVSNVVVVEEMPKHSRGWAVGVASACATVGNGLAILGFGVIGKRSGSWRILYAAAVAPVLLVASFRRLLPETVRFQEAASRDPSKIGASKEQLSQTSIVKDTLVCRQSACIDTLTPLFELFRKHPSRSMSVLTVTFVDNFSMGAHTLYDFKYLQDAHGFAPQHVTLLGLIGGLISLAMYAAVGSVSDRLGRRKLLSGFYTLHSLLTAFYYLIPGGKDSSSTHLVSILWTARVAIGMGMGTLTVALFTEIFPTSHRSTAQCLAQVGNSIGRPMGIFMEGLLVSFVIDSHWHATAMMASLQIICGGMVLLCFPETAGLELEEIEGVLPSTALGKNKLEMFDMSAQA